MAETAQSIINDALFDLVSQEAEQDVEPFEFERGIRYLNRMMAEFSTMGIGLGYTEVSSPNDAITIPAGAMSAVVSNLALRLAPALDVAASPELVKSASDGMSALSVLGINPGKMNFPGNLPIGSGNEYASETFTGQHFYDDCCEDKNEC